MDFSFTDEQLEVEGLARRILSDRVTPDRLAELERSGEWVDWGTYRELAKASLLGIALPEEHGGSGLDLIAQVLVLKQVGRVLAPLPIVASTLMGAMPVARFGTRDQAGRWVPRVADGSAVLTTALVEPSDAPPTDPDTTASRKGDAWVLNGVKSCVSAGLVAERIFVPARADDGSLGVFAVDPSSSGVTVERQETTNREPEAHVTLQNVTVSDADRLGGDAVDGAEIVRWIEQHATVGLCAVQLGVTEKATEDTAAYTSNREQFQRPLAHFQAVAQRAAEMFIDVEGIDLTLWQAAWLLSEGRPAEDEVAVAKFWAADAGHRVAHAGVHLHGGVGVDVDGPFHRYFIWAKKIEFALGHSTNQLLAIGRRLAEV